jgi:hypothetical protein
VTLGWGGTAAVLIAGLVSAAQAAPVWVGRFPAGGGSPPEPWKLQQLNPSITPTRYQLRDWEGVAAIEAQARGSMALLGRPVGVDLTQTPVLCWRWRVDAALKTADMTRKSGDDYAARVYLSFSVPPDRLDFGTRLSLRIARKLYGDDVPDAALNYVWDNRHAIGTWQANAYTERTQMLVMRSGDGDAGRWVTERRDVSADFLHAFGHAPLRLTGLAIATDTDNTGEEAHAGFADFRFVGPGGSCAT